MVAVKASVRIKANERLESLAEKLQVALSLPSFRFDSDMDPPHAIKAMTECLGFELWLYAVAKNEYKLVMEASLDVSDLIESENADASLWLAKHIGIVTDLLCTPYQKDEKNA